MHTKRKPPKPLHLVSHSYSINYIIIIITVFFPLEQFSTSSWHPVFGATSLIILQFIQKYFYFTISISRREIWSDRKRSCAGLKLWQKRSCRETNLSIKCLKMGRWSASKCAWAASNKKVPNVLSTESLTVFVLHVFVNECIWMKMSHPPSRCMECGFSVLSAYLQCSTECRLLAIFSADWK